MFIRRTVSLVMGCPHGWLLEGLGLGRSVCKALKELKLKGLIVHRRNKVIKTFPGKILYGMMVEKIGSAGEA